MVLSLTFNNSLVKQERGTTLVIEVGDPQPQSGILNSSLLG